MDWECEPGFVLRRMCPLQYMLATGSDHPVQDNLLVESSGATRDSINIWTWDM